jgi:transposase
MFPKKLTSVRSIEFFRSQPQCHVALEACGRAYHWGGEIAKLSHMVRLISPAYVKPFVKRQTNDAADMPRRTAERLSGRA